MRSTKPLNTADNSISLHWRGRETGEGESTFGDENIVRLYFMKGGMFKGTMYWNCCGEFEVIGKLNAGTFNKIEYSKKVTAWKSAYRELNEANYTRESAGRRGGGGGYYSDEDKSEPCSDSDVPSYEEGKSEEEEEDENQRESRGKGWL